MNKRRKEDLLVKSLQEVSLNVPKGLWHCILKIRFGFMLVLEGYTLLDLVELGLDPRIIFVAIGVKSSQCL
jgi:hypothetical protein